jgi:hypothetical protein
MVGKCLYGIYKHQYKKEFGKVVAVQDNRYAESYNRFLSFLHHLRIGELSKLCCFYMQSKMDECNSDEEFMYTLLLTTKLPSSQIDKTSLISSYKEKFPQGKYINKLKNF